MKTKSKALIMLSLASALLLIATLTANTLAFEEEGHTIHPFAYGTTTSYTSPPGQKIGCLTSGTNYTLKIDFYYVDRCDRDQRITSLTFEAGDGSHEISYVPVAFPVTWEYSIDGEVTWNPYSGTGDIDVPWSGKNGVGQLNGTEPHATVKVTFPVTGSLGDTFYYRVHFTSYKYGKCPPGPGNAGNHYFWYEICHVPTVPEFQLELPVITMFGAAAAYMIRRRKLTKY